MRLVFVDVDALAVLDAAFVVWRGDLWPSWLDGWQLAAGSWGSCVGSKWTISHMRQ